MRIGASRPHRQDQVSALLAAACAPAHRSELAGEEAAVAAYRAAGDAPPSPAPANNSAGRRLTAGATWLAAVAATVAAGAAVAAAAVIHETPDGRPEAERATAPAVAGASEPPDATAVPPAAGGVPGLPGGTTLGAQSGAASNVPAEIEGLCRAYLARKPAQRAKALQAPGFARLVVAAGGADQVPGYCEWVSPAVPGAGASTDPAPANPPPANPGPADPAPDNPAPTEPPRGKPSDRPGKG